MSCPHCNAAVVAFSVPPPLREHAPATESAICTRCLRTEPAVEAGADAAVDRVGADGAAGGAATGSQGTDGSTSPPDFSTVDPAFPSGEAGVALALLCGCLESFALNRASIEALIDHAEREGADVFAFLNRLDASEAAFDLDRRRAALLDLL